MLTPAVQYRASTSVEGCKAGRLGRFSICASAMPRAKNMAAKGSILKEDEILYQSGYLIYLCRFLTKLLEIPPIIWKHGLSSHAEFLGL